MSQADLQQSAIRSQEMQWTSYHAPAPDEESDLVAQFLTAPYPYQSDQLDQEHRELGGIRASSSMYWPPHYVADHGACYWPPNGDSSNSAGTGASNGGYFDGCCYYLSYPDVSLGINTLLCTFIDLNLVREEERSKSAHLAPDTCTGYLNDGNGSALAPQTKRKVQAGQEGGDLGRHKKKGRASDKKQGKKAVSKTVQKCIKENMQSSSCYYCSDNESYCSQENCGVEDHVAGGGNAKVRAGRGSVTDPQSLYARKRRQKINERLRILQKLVPNGTKVIDHLVWGICTMLEEAVHYVKFLKLQIKMLSSDQLWMYAPMAYNCVSLGIDLNISPPQ